ncbi:MAG: methyltransferase domain-containing protein [Candidatus Riflebacteria bacterium]|nr:methyltransferase domain-containing protein [Candidatus Riflebacteria bacterium]
MPESQIVQQAYDRYSSLYDLILKPWLVFGRERAVELLDLEPSDKILEVGVGTGLSFEYYPPGTNLIGLDYSEGMLRQSLEMGKSDDVKCHPELFQMNVEKIGFRNSTFDKVLAAYVMTVVPDTERAMREIIRVCKPGAKVVMINHLRPENSILATLEDALHPLVSSLGLFSLDRDLLSIIESCNIENLTVEPTSFFRLHHIISFTVKK